MTAHSKIGASSMHRWEKCPGSVKLSEGIESRSSSYAEEGTKAHEIAATVLTTGHWPLDIDDETREAITTYVDAVFANWSGTSVRLVEHQFDLSSLHPGLFGTADCVTYDSETKILRVFDYKHGAGIPVEVENNHQLMYYGLGALMTAGFKATTVELIIVQPRCNHAHGPVRRWSLPAIDMLDFAADVVEFATRTEKVNAPLVPGSHCRFCPAAGICPAIREKALVSAKEEFKPTLSYDAQKLSEVLAWLPAFEGWIAGVREFAYGEAQHGRVPPGWKLVAKRATRKWKNEDEAAAEITARFHLPTSSVFDAKFKSVAEIEKMISKKKIGEIADLITKESSGSKLVPETESGEAIKLDAKSEFSNVASENQYLLA